MGTAIALKPCSKKHCYKTTLNLPDEIYAKIDVLVKAYCFKNRTEFFIHVIRQTIIEARKGGINV